MLLHLESIRFSQRPLYDFFRIFSHLSRVLLSSQKIGFGVPKMNSEVVFGKWICRKVPFFKDFELLQNELGKFLYVFEKADYPRKDNSNYPYSFFSNLLPLLISAIGKLNKINILFDNRRVFGVFTMWENKKTLGYE